MIDGHKKLTARFYTTASGRQPVREWILEQEEDDRRQIGKGIQKVEFGWPIGMPYCRSLGNGLWEVRCNLSAGRIGRVLFCIIENEIALLHAFVKKTQKTPVQDIDLAIKRMKELKP